MMVRRILFLVLLLLSSAPFAIGAQGSAYVVRKNDTLSGIAIKHRVGLQALMKQNRIDKPHKIVAGQVLTIPGAAASGIPRPSQSSAPRWKELDQIPIRSGKWKYIVIHHTASESGTVRGIDRYHREVRHMENGLAYHFIIGNGRGIADGKVAVGNRWTQQMDGGHLASETMNRQSIGICLVGNFDKHRPSPKQMESLEKLVDYLLWHCRLPASAVRTHQQVNTIHTRCPGRHFPAQKFLNGVRQRLKR